MTTLFRSSLLLLLVSIASSALHGQAKYTASRAGDLQVGASYTGADPDYTENHFFGAGIYATFDFKSHYGVVAEFHQLRTTDRSSDCCQQLYERSYEIGGRYKRDYGNFSPYVKVLIGRGVFNFPNDAANIAYNLAAGGVGTDYLLTRHINLNVDYEAQDWFNFPPDNLTPQLLTIGIAYHFQ
jgi:hypothetical protein